MTKRKTRLDESFNSNSLQKSITGQSTTSIDPKKIKISDSGNIIPVNPLSTTVSQSGNNQKDSDTNK